MRQFLLPVLMALALLAGGILHGRWSDRWVPESKAQIAAAGTRITAFPTNLGYWKGVNNDWPELNTDNAVEKVLTRSYTNRLNGNSVGMLLACGDPRNLSLFHTPLGCYPAQGYTLMVSEKHSLRVGPSTVEGSRRRARSPVARSSVRARSAQTAAPVSSNVARAARSWRRASSRRFSRRRNSP